MPRKPPTQSKFTVTTVADLSTQSLDSLDELNKNELKICGRGKRTNVEGIGQLMNVLPLARAEGGRLKSAYLNVEDLKYKGVINALENLGVLHTVLTGPELKALKSGEAFPMDKIRELNTAAEHYMEQAVKYL